MTDTDFYVAGVDIGSTMTKVVIWNQHLVASVIGPTGAEHRHLANRVMEETLGKAKLAFDEIAFVVATGYGRINVPFADKQITEISCHAKGVSHFFPEAHTIVEIGGQDCKGIKLANGRVADFVMNDKCAAGTGRFLEVIAEVLGVKLEDVGPRSLLAKEIVKVSSTCTVFAEQEVVSRLSEGASIEDILAGLHDAIARRVLGMVERIKIQREVVVTGGGAKNIGLVKALERRLGYAVLVPPEPLLTGAIGAALLGRDLALKGLREG
ncbi:MAG: acyl-CoA dehydratase activase, partial [Chloroflexota bacterium]|nr:acyl-CoA dehydratase activase [Chloroflexota bacterium]